MKKVVLAVIDALDPRALERAVEEDQAPALKALMEHGTYVDDCVSTFPSVTPVAASAIATGLGPADHLVPSMNWYHRGEERYVEYGSSFAATRTFGIFRSLTDTVYNMNLAHLTQEHRTVHEHLDDAGLRTACTTYLIYRGRHRHEPSKDSPYSRLAEAAQFKHAVWASRELFYADIFDSRGTGCFSTLGMPGQRDRHAGCVGSHLVENDLFDFLLFSLPDNDTYSHRAGPESQPVSIAEADRALGRLMDAGRRRRRVPRRPRRDRDVRPLAEPDHSRRSTSRARSRTCASCCPPTPSPTRPRWRVCPGARSAQVYVLDEDRPASWRPRSPAQLEQVEGIDLVLRRDGDEGVVCSERGTLRFRPGGDLTDTRGGTWSVRATTRRST